MALKKKAQKPTPKPSLIKIVMLEEKSVISNLEKAKKTFDQALASVIACHNAAHAGERYPNLRKAEYEAKEALKLLLQATKIKDTVEGRYEEKSWDRASGALTSVQNKKNQQEYRDLNKRYRALGRKLK